MGHVHVVAKLIIPVTNEKEVVEYILKTEPPFA